VAGLSSGSTPVTAKIRSLSKAGSDGTRADYGTVRLGRTVRRDTGDVWGGGGGSLAERDGAPRASRRSSPLSLNNGFESGHRWKPRRRLVFALILCSGLHQRLAGAPGSEAFLAERAVPPS
jgi:hypothetical protein